MQSKQQTMTLTVAAIRPQGSVGRIEGQLHGQPAVLDVHLPSLPDLQSGQQLELALTPRLPRTLSAWRCVLQGEHLEADTYSFGGLLLQAADLPSSMNPAFLCIR